MWRELGLKIDLPTIGPWPLEDRVGFRLAIAEVRFSQRKGINTTSHVQFDTVRKMRTAFAHIHDVGRSIHAESVAGFKGLKGDVYAGTIVQQTVDFFSCLLEVYYYV